MTCRCNCTTDEFTGELYCPAVRKWVSSCPSELEDTDSEAFREEEE